MISILQAQAKLQWDLRNELKENVHKKDREALLTYNNQEIPTGEEKVRTRRVHSKVLFRFSTASSIASCSARSNAAPIARLASLSLGKS